MSRRHFFGVAFGAAAVATASVAAPDLSGWTVSVETGPSLVSAYELSRETLKALENNLAFLRYYSAQLDKNFSGSADDIKIRRFVDRHIAEDENLIEPLRRQVLINVPRRFGMSEGLPAWPSD